MMRPIGWKYESHRHSLAARGIPTSRRYMRAKWKGTVELLEGRENLARVADRARVESELEEFRKTDPAWWDVDFVERDRSTDPMFGFGGYGSRYEEMVVPFFGVTGRRMVAERESRSVDNADVGSDLKLYLKREAVERKKDEDDRASKSFRLADLKERSE